MSTDQSLAAPDSQPTERRVPDPAGLAEAAVAGRTQMSVADVIAKAKLPERRAKVYTRGDLLARHDELVAELGTLVNENGELREDAEQALGEKAAIGRAEEINAEIEAIRVEMAESVWMPLFRGISADDLAVFNKEHAPKKDGDDTDYYIQLIARTAVEPTMSVDEVRELRSTLHAASFNALRATADAVCARRIDVPFSPSYSVVPTPR